MDKVLKVAKTLSSSKQAMAFNLAKKLDNIKKEVLPNANIIDDISSRVVIDSKGKVTGKLEYKRINGQLVEKFIPSNRYISLQSVKDKLERYLLSENHPLGRSKAE